jgi:ACR3 family arsenite efflux pump ArsB
MVRQVRDLFAEDSWRMFMRVAAAIAVTLAGRVEFALFATTYFLTEAPLMLGAIIVFRRQAA